ncbi:MAG: LiaF domain-containing protein [candidate division WOR-3 bacterium]
MGLIFTGVFWGAVLILLGIGVILNVILGTKIPFGRIFWALLLIYIGISLLVRPAWHKRTWHRKWTSDKVMITSTPGKHDIVFGSAVFDLTSVELQDRVQCEEIDVVFGSAEVRLNPEMPVRIEVNTVFASAKLPNGNEKSFGEYTYQSRTFDENRPYLSIKADVVFGSLEFVNAKPTTVSPDTLSEDKEGL